jgi:hypothetical protein
MMNSEEILTYLILIAIGYFIAKMFSRCLGNSFTVSNQNCSTTDTYNTLLNQLINNKKKSGYKDYPGRKFQIKDDTFYKTKKWEGFNVCEANTPIERTYIKCNPSQNFCKDKGIDNDNCISRTDLFNYIKENVTNGSI